MSKMKTVYDIMGKVGIVATMVNGKPETVADLRWRTKNYRHDQGASFIIGPDNHALLVFLCGRSLKVYNKVARPFRQFKRWRSRVRGYNTECMTALFLHRKYDDEYGESLNDTILVRSNLSKDALNEHLDDNFTTRCTHEYDCCGHWYGTAWTHKTRKVFPGFYLVSVGSYMNV